jgi:hypothetical protein
MVKLSPPKSKHARSSPQLKPKKLWKRDNTLNDLEILHKSMNIQRSQKIAQGHWMKLELNTATSSKCKKGPLPKFNIEFSTIAAVDIGQPDLPKKLDDDDNLPVPSEVLSLLKEKKCKNSLDDDDFLNSELDTLIPDLPTDDLLTGGDQVGSWSAEWIKKVMLDMEYSSKGKVHILLYLVTIPSLIFLQ